MSWFNRESKSHWETLMEDNQDYLDNRKDPKGFWDTSSHISTMHGMIAETIETWDSEHPEYATDYTYGW